MHSHSKFFIWVLDSNLGPHSQQSRCPSPWSQLPAFCCLVIIFECHYYFVLFDTRSYPGWSWFWDNLHLKCWDYRWEHQAWLHEHNHAWHIVARCPVNRLRSHSAFRREEAVFHIREHRVQGHRITYQVQKEARPWLGVRTAVATL